MYRSADQLIEEIDNLFKEKKYREIINLLSDDILEYHKDAALYSKRAIAHSEIREAEQTILYANSSIEIDQNLYEGYFARGIGMLLKKDSDNALRSLDIALSLNNANAAIYNGMGRVWFAKKEYDRAFGYFKDALAVDENYVHAINNLGRVHFVKKEYKEALDFYDKAIALDESYEFAYNNQGLVWSVIGEYDKAIQFYNRAIELDKSFALAFNGRGVALFNKLEYDKALTDFNTAIKLDENLALAFNNRGRVLTIKKDYDNAFQDLNKAILLDGNLAMAYHNLGLLWLAKQDYDKALENYSKAIDLDENYVFALNDRGRLYYLRKEYNRALQDFDRALTLNNKYTISYNNRGLVYYETKEYDKAIADFNKALDLDPYYVFAYNNRGLVWHAKKVYKKALKDYNIAIKLDRYYAAAYYNRALVYSAQQKLKKAIRDYKKSIETINNSTSYLTQVARSKITVLQKRLESLQYNEISILADQIKQLLLFQGSLLTHYTGLSGVKAMIFEKSKFRLSEGAYLNDTSEGRQLFKYLNFSASKQKTDDTIAEPFVERPFIGSFVTDNKHDDLTLWRMYGREVMGNANGCALTINKDRFLSNLREKIQPSDALAKPVSHFEDQFTFYQIAYKTKDEEPAFIISGSQADEMEFNNLMKKLRERVESYSEQEKTNITELLNSIAFLFKSIDYQYEYEVRLVVQGTGFEKEIQTDSNPPKVYIETVNILSVLNKITLGPKVERASEWAASFNYFIKKQIKDARVDIIISHLPYK